tara:strand:- start:24667 stop:25419 length:753 start_codon:yes stop_codon:yes gene_type:complete
MKTYNIFFILNSPYFTFGKILLKSIYKNCDQQKIKKIYILNTGLSNLELLFLNSFDKVEILDSGLDTNFSNGSWGEDWHTNISLKLRVLGSIVDQVEDPVMMIDGDCMVMKELSNLIDGGGDIQLCYRGKTNPDNPYLGSYVCILDNKKGKLFIDDCVFEMENSADRWLNGMLWPKESLSIGKIATENGRKLNIIDYSLAEVSEFNHENINDCTIVHFKGKTHSFSQEELIKTRIYDRGFGPYVEEYLND